MEVWSNKFSSEHRLKVASSRQLFLTLLRALCSSIVWFLQTVTHMYCPAQGLSVVAALALSLYILIKAPCCADKLSRYTCRVQSPSSCIMR